MMAWIREHLTGRTSPASERADRYLHDVDDLIERRQRESADTVRQELDRRQRLAGANPAYDLMGRRDAK